MSSYTFLLTALCCINDITHYYYISFLGLVGILLIWISRKKKFLFWVLFFIPHFRQIRHHWQPPQQPEGFWWARLGQQHCCHHCPAPSPDGKGEEGLEAWQDPALLLLGRNSPGQRGLLRVGWGKAAWGGHSLPPASLLLKAWKQYELTRWKLWVINWSLRSVCVHLCATQQIQGQHLLRIHPGDNEVAGCCRGCGGCKYSTFGSWFPSLIQHSIVKGHCQGWTEGGKPQKTTQAQKELRELFHLLEGLMFNHFSSIGLVWGEVNQEKEENHAVVYIN